MKKLPTDRLNNMLVIYCKYLYIKTEIPMNTELLIIV